MTIVEDITEQKTLSEELQERMRELRIFATTDGLTKLFNYRYFTENLPKAIRMARETNSAMSLIVLDLDHLKEYNDLGGHHYGDMLLRATADILSKHSKQGDITARYGGDEFVMILRNANTELALKRAESIRESISAFPFLHEEKLPSGNITASFGIAELTGSVQDADELLRRADRALYRAKAKGRNCIHIWAEN